ncbi:response regulator transcription factor [Jeotgalibacillus soli]|uniref:Transcriptional regulator n=1 Tax=Jeotgalibacillus soli TaxID=889306 RepID=A0A0C2VCR2_9BACL|nr:response regulator transcription factor [Jeotgalibacillus soli]KIL46742.1 hypothetical protein KP78_18600 [Jeotgalibacillus soli]
MTGRSILVVDDEAPMRMLIRSFLEKEGYRVSEAPNGIDALNLVSAKSFDLILLDVMMPFMDGYAFTKELKQKDDIPIIFLSAKGEEWDKIKGLKMGADDYIVKPFHSGELLARIETVLRRAFPLNHKKNIIKAGPIRLDLNAHRTFLDQEEISLTLKELNILSLLIQCENTVLSRNRLMESVWGAEYSGTERTVDTHIKTLRIKLKKHGELIKTVWGIGYKFEV